MKCITVLFCLTVAQCGLAGTLNEIKSKIYDLYREISDQKISI